MTNNKDQDGYSVEETVVFKIYDMPQSLSTRFLSYVKEHAGNKGWVAIEKLLDNALISKRLDAFEKRLAKLEEGDKDGKV